MKIRNRAELQQALDAAVERGLDQVRQSFEAAGGDGDDLDGVLASERQRLTAWRDQVEAWLLHEIAAPVMPAGATVADVRKPPGQLH
ncbi:MAG: hypothetical protein GY873_39180 [Bosea sp.]|uniref:hypothetical protein n=1 Tax=Bosea sp. (in: a-proteobacteria) TaxID=1871050 RepID=UPI0023970857|nr:hypothetical protein [Bosea sp. (in: a-proteobacteria)]MCP4740228.1 hypothetical protein [Bosea sp. (in: a-proteobacteria)]